MGYQESSDRPADRSGSRFLRFIDTAKMYTPDQQALLEEQQAAVDEIPELVEGTRLSLEYVLGVFFDEDGKNYRFNGNPGVFYSFRKKVLYCKVITHTAQLLQDSDLNMHGYLSTPEVQENKKVIKHQRKKSQKGRQLPWRQRF